VDWTGLLKLREGSTADGDLVTQHTAVPTMRSLQTAHTAVHIITFTPKTKYGLRCDDLHKTSLKSRSAVQNLKDISACGCAECCAQNGTGYSR
jgi:hypothetical protein